MKFQINYETSVSDVRVCDESKSTKEYSIQFNFSSPIVFTINGEPYVRKEYHINVYFYDLYYPELSRTEAKILGYNQIRKMINGTMTDDEYKSLVVEYKKGNIKRIKDIDDKGFIENFIKMLKIAMIDYQL